MKYFYHDGRLLVPERDASASDLAEMIKLARQAAVDALNHTGEDHAIFAVKHYCQETGELREVDIYCPAITLDDAEFQRRTDMQVKDSPGCYILAVHTRR